MRSSHHQTFGPTIGLMLVALAMPCLLALQSAAATEVLTAEQKSQLDTVVAPLIEGDWVQGLMIGVANEQGMQTFSYGHVNDAPPPRRMPIRFLKLVR